MADNLIDCDNEIKLTATSWQISLANGQILYQAEKKSRSFQIDNIREFQFEVSNGAVRSYADIPMATAYVVLKDDDDPKELFRIYVIEEYILSNQTQAHHFCEQMLKFIGDPRSIPTYYKISVDTKEKQGRVGWIFLALIIVVLMWLLEFGIIKF